MALRNQPYIPLYVQDFLTDEKLNECSAESTGVYIKLMCVMHKSDEYGVILLKPKDKQTLEPLQNFALKLVKHLSFSPDIIKKALIELLSENVLKLDGDKLQQGRMIRDNKISELRAKSGSSGGKKTQSVKAKLEAKPEANTEDESEDVIECFSNKEIEVLFEKFWVAYPKKEGKKPARQKFDSIFKNLTPEKSTKLLETMLNAIEIQKQTDKWKKDKGQFIPMPSTWLNQERWNDETIINVGNKNGKQLTNKFDGISTKLEDL